MVPAELQLIGRRFHTQLLLLLRLQHFAACCREKRERSDDGYLPVFNEMMLTGEGK